MAIIKEGTNHKIENFKATLGLRGDVYLTEMNQIASLESHKALLALYDYASTSETIEEAEIERAEFEKWLEERKKENSSNETEEETGGEE